MLLKSRGVVLRAKIADPPERTKIYLRYSPTFDHCRTDFHKFTLDHLVSHARDPVVFHLETHAYR